MGSWLTEDVCKAVEQHFIDKRRVVYSSKSYSRDYNRYINIETSLKNLDKWDDICYVVCGDLPRVYLCLSGVYHKFRYNRLHETLKEVCINNGYQWEEENGAFWCGKSFKIDYWNKAACLIEALESCIATFENTLCEALFVEEAKRRNISELTSELGSPSNGTNSTSEQVVLEALSLVDVMGLPLHIPEYQRIYCWPQKNLELLLDDLFEMGDKSYHLGTIILQKKDSKLDIIDGQQRLVTLSLILRELGVDGLGLMKEKFDSVEAQEYIAYNRYLIENFLQRNILNPAERMSWAIRILKFVTLDVLTLQDSSLDLAYTFFSTQNSRGKALTDYELLKSHHLRYIPETYERQQRHLATRWDSLLVESERETGDKSVATTLGIYLYCVRKWTRNASWYYKEENRVKNEFEAAPIIMDIPPFGERFDFMDPIQGGAHFFAFVDHFIQQYNQYVKTRQFQIIWDTISCSGVLEKEFVGKDGVVESRRIEGKKRTHWWYGDVISTFLFAYYVKFGDQYLAEALTCITRIVSQLRYQTSKADRQSLNDKACDLGIINMINQATSPTFFLAEARAVIKRLPYFDSDAQGMAGIRTDFFKREMALYQKNAEYYLVDFSNMHNND